MDNAQGKKIYYGIVLDNTQLRRDAEQSRNLFRGIGDASAAEASRIDAAFRKIAGAATAFFGMRQAADFARSIVRVRGEIQALEISFETMLGSKEKADRMMSDVKALALKSPFTLTEVATNTKQLIAMGIAAEKSVSTLRILGDVSAGLSVPMWRLAINYGQISALGKLQMREVRDFAMAGVPIVEELSKMLGKTNSEIYAMIEAGEIGFPIVEKAFENMASKGGKFDNMMSKLNKTVTGQISNLKDKFELMLNDLGKDNEGLIYSAISGASNLVEHYKQIGEALTVLVATYGTYRAALIATEAVRKSVETVKHTEEAAEMFKLLSVEQQAKISKMGLSKASAEYYAAVKAEAAANVQAAQSALTKARAEVTAANRAVAARRAEYVAAKQLEQKRLAELMHIGATGTAKQAEAARRRLAAAETQRESAAIAFQSATRDFNAKKTAVETAASKANTLASRFNTIEQNRNATATGFLTVAKERLAAVTAKLNAVINKNKFALVAAAAVALGYALYKLITYQSDAEKAQSKLNDAIKASGKDIDSEVHQIDAMFGRLKVAKEGTDEYRAAKEAIMNRYGEYLKKLGDEKTALNDIAAAYTLITEEATKAARARAMETFTKDAADTLAEKEGDVKGEVKKLLDKKYKGQKVADGVSLSETYYWKIKPVIEGKAEITDEIQAIIDEFTIKRTVTNRSTGGDSYEVESNELKGLIGEAAKARDIYTRSMEQARIKFGEDPTTSGGGQPTFDAATASLQQLMDRMPKAKEELAALKKAETPDPAAIAAKEQEIAQIKAKTLAREHELTSIKDVKAQIEALQKEQLEYGKDDKEYKEREARIKALQTKLPGAGRTSDETSEYEKIILAAQERRAREEIELERRKIKDKAGLIEFERDQTIKGIEETRREAAKAWAAAGNDPDKFDNQFFDRFIEIVKEQATLDTTDIIAEQKRKEEEEFAAMLQTIRTYEQQRTAIAEEYAKKRKALYEADGKTLRKGVTEGNVAELNRNEEEALKGVDEEFAQREETYQVWMNQIANMTLEGLEDALAQAKAALAEAEKSGVGGSKLAAAKAKVNTAEKKVAKARAENEVSPGKRTIKEWEDLYSTLQEAEREFESIGDAVGGMAGEVIETAGAIMTSTLSMINGIVQLTTASKISLETTSEASAAAIKTVEKASVILTVISAAMSIATTIIGLFNNDERYQKEIEKLQGRIDQLQWELDNADVVRLQKNSEDALDQVKRVYAETTQEVLKLHNITNRYTKLMYDFFARNVYQNEILEKSAEKLAVAYANIEYSANKALGSAKYDEAKEQLRNIAEQQLLMQEQIRKEEAKKKTDHGKIEDWVQQIEELKNEASNLINDLVEDIVGGSAADIAQELGDAFIDAFLAGEDAAEAWGDKVNDIVAGIVKRMLIQKLLEEPIAKLFDAYKDKWFDDGTFLGFDAVNDSMVDFTADLNALITQIFDGLEGLPDEVKDLFRGNADAARKASEKGVATASQESVNEGNGRLTAIQGLAFDIREAVKIIAASKTLDLLKIEINTERLHTIDANLFGLREASNLLVANSARMLQHLAKIEENTSNLHAMRDDLSNIRSEMRSELTSVRRAVGDVTLKGLKLKR